MIRLSVNINKIATLRNARGGNIPDLLKMAHDIEQWGADSITVHPRPDERHIRYADVRLLKQQIKTELNIEGNPMEKKFIDLVCEVVPAQVTLVPDSVDQITSNSGWDTVKHARMLKEWLTLFKQQGIRVSVFVEPKKEIIYKAKEIGFDRVELYTAYYANMYEQDAIKAIAHYKQVAIEARAIDLDINAGHDLSLQNLSFFANEIPWIKEVSIGHALIADALYVGMENAIALYKRSLSLSNCSTLPVEES